MSAHPRETQPVGAPGRARRPNFFRSQRLLWSAVACLSLASCAGGRDSGGDPAALRRLLDEDRQAHLQLDAALLASHLADTLLSIESGQVARIPRGEVESTFRSYFAGAHYTAWEDVEPPVVRIAPGGQMAWVVRKVRVDREQPGAGGTLQRRQFTSAWTATYEWRSSRWQMTTVTSTFVPEPAAAVHKSAAEAPRVAPGDRGASPAPPVGPFLLRQVIAPGDTSRWAAWTPPGWTREKSWPGVVFLHGAGECGEDGLKPTRVGLGPALVANPERWPCVVVFPQKPREDDEWEEHEDIVLEILEAARAEFHIDPERLALTGISQGGHGVWMFGARYATSWSCLAPVCGYGRPRTVARRVARLPVWAFHGSLDDVVDPDESRRIIAAIRNEKSALGLEPEGNTGARLTLYPDANHNSWDPAYAEPALPEWLLSHRRGAAAR